MALRIGIDLGGTKIEIIALEEDGRTLARRRVATPQGDYGATVAAVAGLVAAVEGELGARNGGGGHARRLSLRSGLIKNANSTCLIGKPC
jgi:fructokinase